MCISSFALNKKGRWNIVVEETGDWDEEAEWDDDEESERETE